MREILYRGKRNNGNWEYGFYYLRAVNNKPYIYDDGISFEVIPETVGQFIGITDKNGTKIFEGDILKADNGHVGYVSFGVLPQFGKYCDCHKEFGPIFPDNETVIGNIYDNPELLKEDKGNS